MGHSIAAKYAARPAAYFVRPSSRARERRLGLGGAAAFSPASRHVTTLHGPQPGPLTRLRGIWRGPAAGADRASRVPVDGRLRPAVRMRWTRSDLPGPGRRSGAAAAPWRG